jgi:hypothetical protein
MSLENKIQELTETVSRLIDALNAHQTATVAPAANTVTITAAAPAPVVAPAPVAAPVVAAPAVVMPAPPSFMAPAPVAAPAAAGAPFSDGKGLIDYVMGAYKALGQQKGAQIQGVLTGLGYQNINDVKPEHYGSLFAGVEALKG